MILKLIMSKTVNSLRAIRSFRKKTVRIKSHPRNKEGKRMQLITRLLTKTTSQNLTKLK